MNYDKIIENVEELSENIFEKQMEMQPELKNRYNQKAREKCLQDIQFTLIYLGEALSLETSSIFVNYIIWLKQLLEQYNIGSEEITGNLEAIKQTLGDVNQISEFNMIEEYIDMAIKKIKTDIAGDNSFLQEKNPFYKLAKDYLNLILNYKRREAVELIITATENESIEDIYMQVLQPVQKEMGRLWKLNKITVAQEHYCSSITQLIMSQLYSQIFSGVKKDYTAVLLCTGDELHEIGIRMVADLLELNGWDTIYLGANVPDKDVFATVREHNADLLGISASMSFHVQEVADIIEKLEKIDVKIMVGGYAFNENLGLWKKIGADGYAVDAREAVRIANKLLRVENKL